MSLDHIPNMGTHPDRMVGADVLPDPTTPTAKPHPDLGVNYFWPTEKEDAGSKARSAVEERGRAYRAKCMFNRFVWFCVACVLTVVGAITTYAYETRVTGRITDERPCMTKVGEKTLTGKRTYSYNFTEVLGFRLIDTKKIHEDTIMEVKGDDMVVVGHNKTDWWSVRRGKGEFGPQPLKPADMYVFMVGESVNVVPYRALCQ